MANNIKIIGNINNIELLERISQRDKNLIASKNIKENFGDKEDYIEYYVYNTEGEEILFSTYKYLDYKLPSTSNLIPGITPSTNTTGEIQTNNIGIESSLSTTSSLYPIIEIDPIKDLQNLGYENGEFIVRYNFFENRISNPVSQSLFIKEISKDRTEVRLGSVSLTDEEIESGSLFLIDKINNTEDYYVCYLLNLGLNEQYLTVNVALNRDPEGYEILFKLYEPLPTTIQEKTLLWVVEEQVNPYIFNINLDRLTITPPPPRLRGPNFDIPLENQGTIATSYGSYQEIINNLTSLQSSSYSRLQNLLSTQSIDINVDYTDFNNFIFFGSAYQRVNNFYNKVKEIETYQDYINNNTSFISTTSSIQLTINKYSASINDIIKNFDGFEYYLYFNSGSSLTSSLNYSITPYPKSGSILPYTLYNTTSNSASVWYDYAIENALEYDSLNKDNLEYSIPPFIKDNEINQPFLTFLNMVGHYFDNIWIYLKSIPDINKANNNLNYGISRDLVYQQLKSLGIKLYNSQAGDSVNNYLIGANTGSSVWDNNFTITGSYLNNIPRKDLVAELYKRIYHNLPLLLKTKGTVTGLDNLMTVFGIPNRTYYTIYSGSNEETFYTPTGSLISSSILNVKEFGGSLKSELINGYNNDKVRIVSNSIASGSVLSPIKSLQTYPTASTEFRDDDLHYVDISFSPQTQIDTYISGAISSNNPTWNLDDYIGDPSHLYSGSYPDLDIQRKLYFETGVPGFLPFTASLLDYNGFVRLIEFFDNSLFKMLNDFVPERTSLSTGVTINSPVLERNKAVYSIPSAITHSVYEANYDIADVSSQYGTFYNALSESNNTQAWYNGEISNSGVDINQYFEDNNNPYLEDYSIVSLSPFLFTGTGDEPILGGWLNIRNTITTTTPFKYNVRVNILVNINLVGVPISYPAEVIIPAGTTTGTYLFSYDGIDPAVIDPLIDVFSPTIVSVVMENNLTSEFKNSDWNTLINNVSSSIKSQYRRTFDSKFNNISVYYPSELQDSYLTLRSYNTSRYEGSKLTSLLINKYTSGSYIGADGITSQTGDKSFGKTAAVDNVVRKMGIFTQIETSSFSLTKNNVTLKYLVDEFGGLTELNQQNTNWEEVQRTFPAGRRSTVSLFDNKKLSDQKFTDGEKVVWNSGYGFFPILYWGVLNENIYFESEEQSTSDGLAVAGITGSSYNIKGYPTNNFPLSPVINSIPNEISLYNQEEEDFDNLYTPANPTTFFSGSYTAPKDAAYYAYAFASLEISSSQPSCRTTWSLQLKKNNIVVGEMTQSAELSFGQTSSGILTEWYELSPWLAAGATPSPELTFVSDSPTRVTHPTLGVITYPAGTSWRKYAHRGIFNSQMHGSYNAGDCSLLQPKSLTQYWYVPDLVSNIGAGTSTELCSVPCGGLFGFCDRIWKYTLPTTAIGYYFNRPLENTTKTKLDFTLGFTDFSAWFSLAAANSLFLNAGDNVSVVLKLVQTNNQNYTASLSDIPSSLFSLVNPALLTQYPKGYFQISVSSQTDTYGTASIDPNNTPGITFPSWITEVPGNDNQVMLHPSLAKFIDKGWKQVPLTTGGPGNNNQFMSGSVVKYGNIDYPFNLKPFDYLVIQLNTSLYPGVKKEYTITKIESSPAGIYLTVSPALNQVVKNSLSVYLQAYSDVAIFTRQPDETNAFVEYKKRPGKTSYGFLIPPDLAPDVLENIDTIATQIKQKLNQQNTEV